jgi:hypothetical protein
MDDHFRPIEGHPGYRVSRAGEVQSCWTRRGRFCLLGDDWRPLKPIRRRWGHLTVNLCRAGKKTSRPIHRLVLEVWVGPCPKGLICCHSNGCPWDNRVENLRWDTYQSNSDDSLRHGTRATGSRCGATKLSEGEVIEIRRLRAKGVSFGDLAASFDVTTDNIKAIVYRRSWRHLPEERGESGQDSSVSLGGCYQRQGGMP